MLISILRMLRNVDGTAQLLELVPVILKSPEVFLDAGSLLDERNVAPGAEISNYADHLARVKTVPR